jgi:hypothetical protein
MSVRTSYDFTVGQAVTVSRGVISLLAGQAGRVAAVDREKNTVTVTGYASGTDNQIAVTFTPNWLTPVTREALGDNEIGRWVTFIGQDGTSRPVTFLGYTATGQAYYVEGHVDLKVTLADNIAITN